VEETSPRLFSFDPSQEPTVPRHAATVAVVRDGAQGLEVFCVLRHPRSSFLGGAVVFPGGKMEAADAAPVWAELATEPHPRGIEFDGGLTRGQPALPPPKPPAAVDGVLGAVVTSRALAVAACRETLEEGRVIPLEVSAGRTTPADAEIDALRIEAAGAGGLAAALARRGLRLALDQLVPWARWVTPAAESRRFDARFYLLELPPGQVGRHDEHETTMSFWARPLGILDRFTRGEIFLAPPTTRSLELLASAPDVRAARALAGEQSLRPICPLFVPDDQANFLALPGDPTHPVRERAVAGPTRFVLRDGRFVSEEAPMMGALPPNPRAEGSDDGGSGAQGGRAR
jgi:8-oxo-dGTP pyrophosphatase MutT (NUDIX family)